MAFMNICFKNYFFNIVSWLTAQTQKPDSCESWLHLLPAVVKVGKFLKFSEFS